MPEEIILLDGCDVCDGPVGREDRDNICEDCRAAYPILDSNMAGLILAPARGVASTR